MQNFTLKILDIREETKDTITLCFKQPALKKIKYQAGQYLTLILRINGRRYIRPYSFSSAPGIDANLEVTIKRVIDGVVSNYIHDQIKIGDLIEVMTPMGNFVIPELETHSIFLWGAGSGITPLYSIAKYLLKEKEHTQLKLVYGNKNKDQTIFYDGLEQLCVEHQNRFKVSHFHSQLETKELGTNITRGRIDFLKIIREETKETLNNSIHFICGPKELKLALQQFLTNLNIRKECVFVEDFELTKDPKNFEDIKDQEIRLQFEGREYFLGVIKGKSILEAALEANIELPYSCQTGNCNTCKGFLKSGAMKMIGPNEEREDLENGEYLLCCSYPLNQNIYIEV